MSTEAFDPHTNTLPGETGSRAATLATIAASIRLLKSPPRIAGSRVSARASAKSRDELSNSRSSSLNSTSSQVLEESNSATGTGLALAFLYRIIAMSGTTPEPATFRPAGQHSRDIRGRGERIVSLPRSTSCHRHVTGGLGGNG